MLEIYRGAYFGEAPLLNVLTVRLTVIHSRCVWKLGTCPLSSGCSTNLGRPCSSVKGTMRAAYGRTGPTYPVRPILALLTGSASS